MTFRLKPEKSFLGLSAKFTTNDGYRFIFHDEMVWIHFEASPNTWLESQQAAREALRILLAILTAQTEYPFDLEPLQWFEDKPRDAEGKASYVLGKLGPDLRVRAEPPAINADLITKGAFYARLASLNKYYHYALLDYSVALSIPIESIIFCARSVEWIESFFDEANLACSKPKPGARRLMRDALVLPDKWTDQFFRIANETVIARHAGDTKSIRRPKIEEIRFSVYYNRIVLDRFAGYVWYEESSSLPSAWTYPVEEKPPRDKFTENNKVVWKTLKEILQGDLA